MNYDHEQFVLNERRLEEEYESLNFNSKYIYIFDDDK